MTKNERKCLYCNELIKGRSDKKFCTTDCKSAYHNQRTNAKENYIKQINSQLRKNRSALKKACPWGKATVRKDFLKQLGMDFKYLTHTWRTEQNNLYYFCYDYGYMQIKDTEKVLIIQTQDYMES